MAFKYPLLLKWKTHDTLLFAVTPGTGLAIAAKFDPPRRNEWIVGWNSNEDRWEIPSQAVVDRIMSDVRNGKHAYKDR